MSAQSIILYIPYLHASLREMAYLPRAQSLLWATSRAHGKQLFCCVSSKKHTVNIGHTAKQ